MKIRSSWTALVMALMITVFTSCNNSAPSPERDDLDHTDNDDTMNRVIDSLRTHHVNDSGQVIDTR